MHPDHLKSVLTAAFAFADAERRSLQFTVLSLDPRTKRPLVEKYGEANAWRGLADQNHLLLCDTMDALERTP